MKLGDITFKDANIESLLSTIEKVDLATRDEVLKAINTRLTQAGKTESLSVIKKIIESADPEIKKWLSSAIPKSYANGLSFSDYEFNSIRLNSKVAERVVQDTMRQTAFTKPAVASLLKKVDTNNIYSWGDLYTKMGRAVKYDPVAMGDIRNHIITRWKMYVNEPQIMKTIAGNEFEKHKLRITAEDIKVARDLSIHADSVNALLSDAYLDFASGMNGLVKGAEQKLNEAIKRQIRGKILAKEIAGQNIAEVSRDIKKLLGDKGFNVLIDRGGHSWTLKRYTEMLARTHVIKASNEALINRAGQFGVDIVQVSSHGGACPICVPYEGTLYSLSGQSENYPALNIGMPIHPNCRHVLLLRPDLN